MTTPDKLSVDSPIFSVKLFKTIERAYDAVRDVLRDIQTWRDDVTKAVEDHADIIAVEETSGVPGSTPASVGLHYLDTAAKDMYVSVGTASSADWKKTTP